jgi:hypothetical protein
MPRLKKKYMEKYLQPQPAVAPVVLGDTVQALKGAQYDVEGRCQTARRPNQINSNPH